LSTGAADGSMGGITWAQNNIVTERIAGFIGCALSPFTTNGSSLVFYTRSSLPANLLSEKMVINGNGNVGIGLSNPGFPLNFKTDLGDKISLFGTSGAHYGIGIQPNLMQLHTSAASEDIAFGFGNSLSFIEKFRFRGSGAFAVNGNPGANKQILTSNGPGASPTWQGANTIINVNEKNTSFAFPSALNTPINLTNSNFSVTVTVPSQIMVYYKIFTKIPCPAVFCNLSAKWYLSTIKNSALFDNYGILARSASNDINETTSQTIGPEIHNVPIGTTTFEFRMLSVENTGYQIGLTPIVMVIPN
jgi:hypothetical protein